LNALTFWFDPISPFAHLAFARLPDALTGLSYSVSYRPILFAALLKVWGQKGPAEIEPKRAWTFRHVAWWAHRHGLPLEVPLQHPFNPLALLRLMWACAPDGGTPNRQVCDLVLRHVWAGGLDANETSRLTTLRAVLAPQHEPDSDEVKARLRAATDEAVARGIFGVPTIEVDGRLFWGLDALDMLAAYLHGDPWFEGPDWVNAGKPRPGIQR
jgi:2-hydroxychromene-2-carboxylate isomerase